MNSFNKIPYEAVIVLFSKIIIKRLSRDQLNIFRKVEKITKSFIKNKEKIGFPMPTLKNGFQILNLHPKEHVFFKKVFFLMYFCPSFTVDVFILAQDCEKTMPG